MYPGHIHKMWQFGAGNHNAVQCCIAVPVLNSDQHKDVCLYLLQEYNGSELAIPFYPKTAQAVAATQQELQLAETYSELQHARDVIDDLNAQLNTTERSAVEQYSRITRELEYMERVMYHWCT